MFGKWDDWRHPLLFLSVAALIVTGILLIREFVLPALGLR